MVILSDLSELFNDGIIGMHVAVEQYYYEKFLESLGVPERTKRQAQKLADDFAKSAETWFAIRKEHMNKPFFLELMRGKMTQYEFWTMFCDDPRKPEGISPEELIAIFYQRIRGKIDGTREVFEGIIAHPNSLRRCDQEMIEGCPSIIMVSDHIRECVDILHQAHPEVFDLFSYEVWSFERGEIKSDPGFFDRLLRDLGLRARDTLFIDDLLVNCESAARSHIKAIRFTSVPDLIRSLEYNRFVIDPRVKAKYLSHMS